MLEHVIVLIVEISNYCQLMVILYISVGRIGFEQLEYTVTEGDGVPFNVQQVCARIFEPAEVSPNILAFIFAETVDIGSATGKLNPYTL